MRKKITKKEECSTVSKAVASSLSTGNTDVQEAECSGTSDNDDILADNNSSHNSPRTSTNGDRLLEGDVELGPSEETKQTTSVVISKSSSENPKISAKRVSVDIRYPDASVMVMVCWYVHCVLFSWLTSKTSNGCAFILSVKEEPRCKTRALFFD